MQEKKLGFFFRDEIEKMHLKYDVHSKRSKHKKINIYDFYTQFFFSSNLSLTLSVLRMYLCVPKAFSRRDHLERSSRTVAHWHRCNSTWAKRRVALSMHPNNVYFLWHYTLEFFSLLFWGFLIICSIN